MLEIQQKLKVYDINLIPEKQQNIDTLPQKKQEIDSIFTNKAQ